MSGFDLDLKSVEDHIDDDGGDGDGDGPRSVVLGILDGTTPDREWIEAVDGGDVLFLSIEGDMNDLAAGFAREIRDGGGELVHFRGFLVVTPPGVSVDTERLRG